MIFNSTKILLVCITLSVICFSTIAVRAEVYWSRTVEVKTGILLPKAVGLAIEFQKVASRNGVDLKVTLPIAGKTNRIRWTAVGPNVAALQENLAKLQQTQDFQRLFLRGSKIYINAIDDWWVTPF